MAEMQLFLDEVGGWAAGGSGGPAGELASRLGMRTVVLVEGLSDLAAVETLAVRRGRDLAAEGVCVVPMGGAMNVGRYAGLLGRPGLGLRLTGLCDEREHGYYVRGLRRAQASDQDIFVCVSDLEDELIRALGTETVEEVVREEGDFRALRTFLHQPAQQGRSRQQQLRRFLGTKKGRKIRYGTLLVEALDVDAVPTPLEDLFANL
ncbi:MULTISPECIES: TOPRIM nucleotidyl transferase/hydrolase domain-containing protein [Streptomyces]|uniref:TOPRIM nucleotidyl transferase/hydrolase domain-containing protein n=1 Tax=Streptomyces solicathayae TaxID=3081768 RepID=A0ABZ0LKP1_9ACTN|nr:TOPRIM nucleotidyl transferase/hydrolase domain-containing protein [Streptomyces sp. HUAS YS2]WOX20073.1 TOPRIM nucleotidyl transferase/hydrolase domain-containing protein [Streptomyces sp. HUAS YS2]